MIRWIGSIHRFRVFGMTRLEFERLFQAVPLDLKGAVVFGGCHDGFRKCPLIMNLNRRPAVRKLLHELQSFRIHTCSFSVEEERWLALFGIGSWLLHRMIDGLAT